MEQATPEHEAAVSRVYEIALEVLARKGRLNEHQQVVYAIEHLMQEANSGASFEQYFRWSDVGEIRRIAETLSSLGLDDIATLTKEAIVVAFPEGLPATDKVKRELTDWTEDQETELERLFEQLEDHNGRVTNVLGAYIARVGV